MAQCKETQFEEQHGGLQELTPIGEVDRFRKFRDNFKGLVNRLRLVSPHSSGKISQLFEIQGFYIGKQQLKCLLDKEFAEYDGIQITFGLDSSLNDKKPDKAPGRLTLLVRGSYGSKSLDTGKRKVGDDDIDLRYYEESKTVYVAARPLVMTDPPPNSMPVPPYGDE